MNPFAEKASPKKRYVPAPNKKKPHCLNPAYCKDQTRLKNLCNKPITRKHCQFRFKGRGYEICRNQSLRGRPASSGSFDLELPLEVVEEAIV